MRELSMATRCMRYNCDGHFERAPDADDYYRRLYESGDVQRIFSAEHTGLLDRDTRERIEDGFRKNDLPGDPNLLSCTPTLEMGINIGDLSSIALCSVPPKPSNYLQRVGRCGPGERQFVCTRRGERPSARPVLLLRARGNDSGPGGDARLLLERIRRAGDGNSRPTSLIAGWKRASRMALLPDELRAVLDVVESGDERRGFPPTYSRSSNRTARPWRMGFSHCFKKEVADYTRERIRAFSRGTDLDIIGLERSIWEGLEEVADGAEDAAQPNSSAHQEDPRYEAGPGARPELRGTLFSSCCARRRR